MHILHHIKISFDYFAENLQVENDYAGADISIIIYDIVFKESEELFENAKGFVGSHDRVLFYKEKDELC